MAISQLASGNNFEKNVKKRAKGHYLTLCLCYIALKQ